MRVARFAREGEDPRYAVVDEPGSGESGDQLVVLKGDPMFAGFQPTGERIPLSSEVKLLAPVIPRSKVVCVGMNFPEHRSELEFVGPDNPVIFLKPNTAVIGPGDAIRIPPVDGRIVHEGELAVVIGGIGKQVPAKDWKSIVFGYTIGNDVSARDVMFRDGQWARAKGYDTFCPLGPWIETELDPGDLEITTYVDGEQRRHGRTSDLLYPIPELIEFITDVWTLLPGDVILTGTPAGPGGFVEGQVVDIDIEGIGRLSNPARRR